MIFVVLFLLLYTSLTYQIISAEGIIYVGFSYVGDIIFDVKYRPLYYIIVNFYRLKGNSNAYRKNRRGPALRSW